MPKSVPKSIQTCFRVIFLKKFYAQCSMEGRVFESFQRNQKVFKIPKMPKIIPKSIQTCFEHVLGRIFRKTFFAQCSMETSKIFKKSISKFHKCPKVFPKVSKRVLNLFWVKFFEKFFCPVFRGGSSFRKFSKKNLFKIPKRPKIIPKSIQTCFEHVLGRIFRKTFFCPVFHGDFENFQKKYFKIP